MKVLLISANTLNTPYPVYPIGIDYVAAALLPKHQVKIVDMNIFSEENLGAALRKEMPEVVGISLRNIDNTDTTAPQSFISDYKRLVALIRNHTKAPIVLGGAGFSIFPDDIINSINADYGIIGEGERFADFLDALESNAAVEKIPGIVLPNRPSCPPRPTQGDFSRYFDPSNKHLAYYLERGGMLNIQTKRGCPFRCVYCTYPHIEGNKFRKISPESVADTAKKLEQAGAKYFFIADSVFNGDFKHSLAVAKQFRKKGISIPWGAFLAPVEMPKNYLETLSEAGLTHVEFGTESLSNRVLNAYGKPFRRCDILQAHEAAVQAGMYVAHYFLMGGPGENKDTLETTLTYIDKLEKSVLFFFCGIRIYPHTRLFEHAVSEGQISVSQELLTPVFYQSPAISSDAIVERVQKAANGRLNWFFGAGGDNISTLLQRMYKRGHTGPLWEYLIR